MENVLPMQKNVVD